MPTQAMISPVTSHAREREPLRIKESGIYTLECGNPGRFFFKRANVAGPNEAPRFVDQPWVEILETGRNKPEFPMDLGDERSQRYAASFARWQADMARGIVVNDGISLEAWGHLDSDQIDRLKMNHVFTVDALADLNDGKIGILGPGGRETVRKAREFVDKQRAEQPFNDLRRELAAVRELAQQALETAQQAVNQRRAD